MLLALISHLYAAANAWTPTCSSSADPSVWFLFSATDPKATPLPEYDCNGLFFATTPCPMTLGIGKIRATGTDGSGYATYELRYLPAGDSTGILTFLNQPGGGVAYKHTVTAGAAPPQPGELFAMYLAQRNKASAATAGVALNVWGCPDIELDVPETLLAPTGMKLVRHLGKTSVY